MLKHKYYCLIAGFPDLDFGEKKTGITSLAFRNELKAKLNRTDFDLVQFLFLPFDNQNVLTLLFGQNKSFNSHGNLPENFLDPDLEHALLVPSYITHFINWTKKGNVQEITTEVENLLYTLFYEHTAGIKNKFLRDWFHFDLNIRNIQTALQCRKYDYNLKHQLIYTPCTDSVFQLLNKTMLKPELFEEELPFAEQIFRVAGSETPILEKEKAMDKIKWEYINEQVTFDYFTIEKVLSFVIKLLLVERWIKLDIKAGKELLTRLIEELKTSYEFPLEFSTVR